MRGGISFNVGTASLESVLFGEILNGLNDDTLRADHWANGATIDDRGLSRRDCPLNERDREQQESHAL